MEDVSVLVIDSDAHSTQVLLEDLGARGFARCAHVVAGAQVPAATVKAQPDLVLFNHHFDRHDEVLSCCTAKLAAPHAMVVALATTGPGMQSLRAWNQQHGYVDAILEKPLKPGDLAATLRELGERKRSERGLRERADKLASLLPAGALQALHDGAGAGTGDEMFEAAVLFTDVRRSSEMITSQPARAYFRLLNASLSAQSARVRAFDGAVVKYTGDGMMAVFRGMGRAHLALRCALSLAEPALQDPLSFGVGVAEGLVLAGLVGDFEVAGQRQQYDVIGATVHLSARLCAQAGSGEVLATREVLQASRLGLQVRDAGPLKVRGFAAAIDCVALGSGQARLQTT
jgi:adenylate cyclase